MKKIESNINKVSNEDKWNSTKHKLNHIQSTHQFSFKDGTVYEVCSECGISRRLK
jgi:hypothetical protein